MRFRLQRDDRLGLTRPALDAHTLGISSVAQLLRDSGYKAICGDPEVCQACQDPENPHNLRAIARWIRREGITALGFSYRLDPADGAAAFARLVRSLKRANLTADKGGPIRALFFAGLPEACGLVRDQNPDVAGTFCGDETPSETFAILGVETSSMPGELARGIGYDEDRLAFGRELIAKGEYHTLKPQPPGGYREFGTRQDTIIGRLRLRSSQGLPVMRAHVGPYLQDRQQAVELFLRWCRELAASGHLDVLSIGTSQLTQSNFGEDWAGRPNGGGVPLNSPSEFAAAYEASRPMLVRTYAGTRNIPRLARMYEETINIAWHALSLWWFCRIDGRGPYTVRENLQQHIETLTYVAKTGKPFEPNVPHHFAFRGADDVTYIVSAVLSARLAKAAGIRVLILQNMLNTPKYTWGIQDLAKSRAMLRIVRRLEDERFRVILQPRGGLDYFSPDPFRARTQLAAVTALMDDIEPQDPNSPPIIHVVSYSEASHLADPQVVNESIQITRQALKEYRRLRSAGQIDDMSRHPDVIERTESLVAQADMLLNAIEAAVPDTYTADGLYRIFAMGFLPVPYLYECRQEFSRATAWDSRLTRGAVELVDAEGRPISMAERIRRVVS